MKILSYTGLVIAFSSLLMMILGHMGVHELSWRTSQISSYAARAPYDYFITSAIFFSALSLVIISVLISHYHIAGNTLVIHIMPVLLGGAAIGLLMLASYEETASTLSLLKQSSFWQIRIQSFHDAGLLIFFYSMLLAMVILGLMIVLSKSSLSVKIIGVLIASSGPASYLFMTTAWPKLFGIEGVTTGINQRSSLLVVWLAMVLILYLSVIRSEANKHREV